MKEYKKKAKLFSLKKNKTNIPSVKITSSEIAFKYITKYLYDDSIDIYESFWLLLLNRASNITGFVKISQGGISGTVVDIKLIAKYVIENLSNSIIIAHNHPSENIQPSGNDIEITNKIKETMKLIDSTLIDHLIVSGENYYSFNDENLI